ncbi:TPA: LacI family DNA-binding transcriptional regulator [Vibrio parahaemolyticus]
MSKVSIKEVAEYSGVSIATVSQVLRNKGRISEATRNKVKKALDTLGYVYNQNAANLRAKKSNQIGLLVHDISNPFYGEMAASLSRVIDDAGNMLFLSNTEGNVDKQERLTKALIQNGAAGIIICASNSTPDRYFDDLKSGSLPVVLVTRHESKDLDFVGTDNVVGGHMATQHLIDLGHKKIAFIGGELGTINRNNRILGYKTALANAGLLYDESLNIPTETSKEAGAHAIEMILSERKDVTACLFYQDVIAHGAMEYLRANGLVAGKDISIIGLDGTEASLSMSPSLTSVSFSAEEMGVKAAQLLFERLNESGPEAVQKIIIEPKLIAGESTGAI